MRCTARASAWVNSALVGVRGAHRLTGPLIDVSWPTWIAAATQSRSEIIGKNWRPSASWAPSPSLNSRQQLLQRRRGAVETGTVRSTHTRAPGVDGRRRRRPASRGTRWS